MSHFIQKNKKMKQPSLSYLFDSFERFHEFVTDYYEITVDEALLSKLYNHGYLSEVELEQLIHNSQIR